MELRRTPAEAFVAERAGEVAGAARECLELRGDLAVGFECCGMAHSAKVEYYEHNMAYLALGAADCAAADLGDARVVACREADGYVSINYVDSRSVVSARGRVRRELSGGVYRDHGQWYITAGGR